MIRRESHPMWVRGLKLEKFKKYLPKHWSHPMWVRGLKQRGCTFVVEKSVESHPMWVRGLKRNSDPKVLGKEGSHPMWVRGLKHFGLYSIKTRKSRTLCGCVD